MSDKYEKLIEGYPKRIAALEAERDKALHSARRFCAAHVGTEDPNGCPVCEIAKLRAVVDAARPTVRRLNSYTLFSPTWEERVALATVLLDYDLAATEANP